MSQGLTFTCTVRASAAGGSRGTVGWQSRCVVAPSVRAPIQAAPLVGAAPRRLTVGGSGYVRPVPRHLTRRVDAFWQSRGVRPAPLPLIPNHAGPCVAAHNQREADHATLCPSTGCDRRAAQATSARFRRLRGERYDPRHDRGRARRLRGRPGSPERAGPFQPIPGRRILERADVRRHPRSPRGRALAVRARRRPERAGRVRPTAALLRAQPAHGRVAARAGCRRLGARRHRSRCAPRLPRQRRPRSPGHG